MAELENYDDMSVQQKWNILAMVANMYYNSNLTQSQIAERLYTSRSKVSRMLKEARELGIVRIDIKEPWERNLEYETNMKALFPLDNIRVVKVKSAGMEDIERSIGQVAAYYLDSIIKKDIIVGISWGNTLYRVVKYISANNKKNIPITVVPIMGAANTPIPAHDAIDLAKELAMAYGGEYRYIFAPLFVRSKELKDELLQEESIRDCLELSRKADIILTSVGSVSYKSWKGFLNEETLQGLESIGAVGHIGGHFFDIEGKELGLSINSRIIGLSFQEIKDCGQAVCIICNKKKSAAAVGAVRSGVVNTLIVDEFSAEGMMEIARASSSV